MSDLNLNRVLALVLDPHVPHEHRLAAIVVLGALEVKDAKAIAALEKVLTAPAAGAVGGGGAPAEEQRVALDALARIGPKKVLPRIFPLLTSTEPKVRDAAARALKAAGAASSEAAEEMVEHIKARKATASDAEKRELDKVLADLGGADAFKALLDGIVQADEKTARQLALAVRERIASADKRTRKSYASSSTKALERATRQKGPNAGVFPHQEAALIKILGWCEDESSVGLLVDTLHDAQRPPAVRQEAAIALRFALKDSAADAQVVEALLDAASGEELALARTAVDTLAGLTFGPKAIPKLRALALHRDPDRALFAVRKLAADASPPALKVLVDAVLGGTREVSVAAADALTALTSPECTSACLAGVLETSITDRALLLVDVLKPRVAATAPANGTGGAGVGARAAKKPPEGLPKGIGAKLVDATITRLERDGRGYEATLALARVAAPEATAEALRDLAAKLKKQKKDERAAHVLILLTHSTGATDDDRVRLALLALKKSRLDPRPDNRARDEAIKLFEDIAGTVDVLAVLKKDKSITDEQLFYLGFHFAEEGDPIGEQLLSEVVARSPRSKIGKAAKNKLKLEAEA